MTMTDQRNQARWAYEERARQAQAVARAADVNSEVFKPAQVGMPLIMTRIPLGVQYMAPEVQPPPTPVVSRPPTKSQLCAQDCGCGLTICRRYGDVRH